MNRFRNLMAIGLVLAVSACGGRREVYRAELDVLGPFPIPFGLAFLNRTTSELIRVRLTSAGLSADELRPVVDRVRLGVPGARQVLEVAAGDWLAVLHADAARPGLSLVAPTGNQVEFHPLADSFDALAVAPSGRFGVAYFSDPGADHPGIRNLNQVQVVDFENRQVQPARALETGGLSPLGVDFVPPDGSQVMFFHHRMGQTDEPGMRVVRIARPEGSSHWTHRISTFGLQSEPGTWAFDPDGQDMLGSFSTGANSFLLDLASGRYASLSLDREPLDMGVLSGTDVAWFQHAHPLGSLSLVPLGDFRREAVVMVEGFVLSGLLDP